MKPPRKPLLVYDGDCGLCRLWIARWRRLTGDRVDYAPSQEVASRFPEIPPERFQSAVQLLEPDGNWSEGAEAVFRSLARAPGSAWLLALYRNVPGFAPVSEWCYRLVARNRPAFTRLTRSVWGPHVVPPGETLTAGIFLRLVGIIYAIAFVSLWSQILGLVGSDGILPFASYLEGVRERAPTNPYWFAPTVLWLARGDGTLVAVCATGTVFSLFLAMGIAPVATLFGAWVLYLSLASVCQDFLWFQWDSLLLETGLAALLLAPWRWWSRPGSDPPPSRWALWLSRWLLFRLMVSSAVVKLTSGDPTWHGLTALDYHYETQPLPPWTAWYVHQIPDWFQKASVVGMFAIEGVVPFLIIAPRRLRFAAGGAIVALQVVIMATGNYGFFNLLAIALCVPLLDDGAWPWRWLRMAGGQVRRRSASRSPGAADPVIISGAEGSSTGPGAVPPSSSGWSSWVTRSVVATLVLLSWVPIFRAFRLPPAWLGPLPVLYRFVAPFRPVNHYGLFAVMTTERPEIVIEGSSDGIEWRTYEFRWKPGDLARRPRFVAPHMPRLDWQMWFAAFRDYREDRWFILFCQRLLQGSAPVLALLETHPFPDSPPRYLRARLYDYRFTDPAGRRETGAWWRRNLERLYCPILMLENGRVMPVPENRIRVEP